MQELQAINIALTALGEHPVSKVDPQHPTVNPIRMYMEQKRRELLLKGWWFNTKHLEIYPNEDDEIRLPDDTLAVLSDFGVQDGEFLVQEGTLSKRWKTKQLCTIKVDRPFERLPDDAANWVLWQGLIDFYIADIGVEKAVEMWQQNATEAYSRLTAEHLRNKRYSTRKSPRYRRISKAIAGG